MGASSTVATVASYQVVKTKERGYAEYHPQVSVLGLGLVMCNLFSLISITFIFRQTSNTIFPVNSFDRTLGGLEIQIRLRDYLAKAFNEMKKTKNDVFANPRAMAKLFKEAGRVKNVLSANVDHYAQIENLIDEQDFRYQVETAQRVSKIAEVI